MFVAKHKLRISKNKLFIYNEIFNHFHYKHIIPVFAIYDISKKLQNDFMELKAFWQN